jgi:hypothetical protein
MTGRDLQRAKQAAKVQIEERLARQMARIRELDKALRDLRLTARVLLQNAEGCAAQHHGATEEAGWLRDCRLKIEAAEAVLKD